MAAVLLVHVLHRESALTEWGAGLAGSPAWRRLFLALTNGAMAQTS